MTSRLGPSKIFSKESCRVEETQVSLIFCTRLMNATKALGREWVHKGVLILGIACLGIHTHTLIVFSKVRSPPL